MTKQRVLSLTLVAVLLVSVLGMAANQEILLIPIGTTTEIDGSQPSYVSIGWAEYADVWKALGYKNYRSYIEGEEIKRMLDIDGTIVEPTSLAIHFDPHNPSYGAIWTAMWTFRFKPNELPAGTHRFQGWVQFEGDAWPSSFRWITVNYP